MGFGWTFSLQSAAQGYGQPGGFSGSYGDSFGGGSDGAYGGSYSGPGSYSYSSPDTGSRVYPETINFAQRGGFGGLGSGAASSSASIGPGGGHQTASVNPENPVSLFIKFMCMLEVKSKKSFLRIEILPRFLHSSTSKVANFLRGSITLAAYRIPKIKILEKIFV